MKEEFDFDKTIMLISEIDRMERLIPLLKDAHTQCEFPKWFSKPFEHYFIMIDEKAKTEDKVENIFFDLINCWIL